MLLSLAAKGPQPAQVTAAAFDFASRAVAINYRCSRDVFAALSFTTADIYSITAAACEFDQLASMSETASIRRGVYLRWRNNLAPSYAPAPLDLLTLQAELRAA